MNAEALYQLLCDDAYVFAQTPPWRSALAAQQALSPDASGGDDSVELEEHQRLLTDFVEMVRDNLDGVGPALLNAAFLAGVGPGPAPLDTALPEALRRLATGLRFDASDTAQVKRTLQAFQAHLQSLQVGLPPPPQLGPEGALVPGSVAHIGQALVLGRQFRDSDVWPARVAAAWHQLLQRLPADERDSVAAAGYDEVLCAARGVGPASVLPVQLAAATLHRWTQALLMAVRPHGAASAAGPTASTAEPSPGAGGAARAPQAGTTQVIGAPGAAQSADVPRARALDALPSGAAGTVAPSPAVAEVPFALAGHALLHCGFPYADPGRVESLCSALELRAGAAPADGGALRGLLLAPRPTRGDATPLGSVIVVRADGLSVTDKWTETPTRALVLVLALDEFRRESEEAPSVLGLLPPPLMLAWERSERPDAAEVEQELRAAALALGQAHFQVLDASRSTALATARGPDELVALQRP